MLKSKEKAKRFRKIIVILIAITMILGIYIKEIYTQKREIKTIGVDQIQHMDATISAGNGTINPIYRPKWTKTSSTLNTDAQTLSIVVKGNASESQTVNGANIKYNSDVTSALSADDIIVYVDGELDGDTNKNGVLDEGETPSITKAVSTADSSATSAEVTHTITLSNFGEALRQEGKEFREWSGNVAIKIGGRGQDESTYSANVLTDKYGNENMMETDMDGTNDDGSWVSVIFKDGSIDHNANGTMFTDFVKPEFTYEYANTVIDHDTKTVTVVFDVTDKYFASTVLATDPQAENITVKLDGKEATNATKALTKLSDITATVNGNTSTKIGEKYQLVVSNLDQGSGDDYSGIMTLAFPADIITDKSANTNIPKTITIGTDDPTTNDGHDKDVIVDVVDPVWKIENISIDGTTKTVKADLIATDKYLTGVDNCTLTTDDITLSVDGDENANTAITKTLSDPTFSENVTTGMKEIKYTLTLDNWEEATLQDGKSFFEYSGTVKIKIKEGTITDDASSLNNVNGVKPSELFDQAGSNADGLHIGDFVDYDAGTWTQEEINSIKTGLKTNLQTANGSTSLPSNDFQFGGFKSGSSRNGNAARYDNYIKDKSTNSNITGWRVFDIDGDNVTLISAGNPEYYYHPISTYGESCAYISEYILNGNSRFQVIEEYQKRDWSSYVNKKQKAIGAMPFTASKLTDWYSKYMYDTSSPLSEVDRFRVIYYQDRYIKYQNIIDNYNEYMLAEAYDPEWMYSVDIPNTQAIVHTRGESKSIRMLVTLSPDVLFNSQKTGTKTLTGGNMNTYGGDQTYNCWSIATDSTSGSGSGSGTNNANNTSKETEFEIGHVDFIKPRIIKGTVTRDIDKKTVTITFGATDKYLDTTSEIDLSKIKVKIDGEEATGITKTLTRETEKDVSITINGKTQVVSQQYKLVLSDFEQSITEIDATRNYVDWSGTVTVDLEEGVIKDKESNGTSNFNDSQTINAGIVDFIAPKVTYQYVNGDINYDQKTFTMKFDITDKYFTSSTLATEYVNAVTDEDKLKILQKYLTIKIDGEDVTTNDKVTKRLVTIEDVQATRPINKTIDGVVQTGLTNQVIGKSFTLEMSALQQDLVAVNKDYLDYSGVITVAIKENVAMDNGPKGDGSNKNGNINTTITSGVDIPTQDENKEGTIVDVVDPIWEVAGTATAQPARQTANLPIKGTDKYIKTINLTPDDITVEVDGVLKTSADGISVTITEDDTAMLTYGKQYNIKIDGYSSDAYQVRVTIREGTIVDNSGNISKQKSFILFSSLINTSQETGDTSPFLGNSNLQRKKIEKIIFQDDLDGINDTRWDVTQMQDESIWGWYTTDAITGNYTVYIGSYIIMNGNVDSRNLFSYIGSDSTCKVTGNPNATDGTQKNLIENIELLHVNAVKNMSHMFDSFGNKTMKSFSLGTTFDTGMVKDMAGMFRNTGYTAMTSLDLGDKFNTGSVTSMNGMFYGTGYTAMTSLNLGDKFNTGSVTSMNGMFYGTGYTAMTSLDLGDKFDTRNVTDMGGMFKNTGYTAMTSLNLGNKFDTNKATNMESMFNDTGHTAMTSLDLGNKFYTTSATNMENMFLGCGTTALKALDLGPGFTKIASQNTNIFTNTGTADAIIYAPESIVKDEKNFKLSTSDESTTINYANGTINPIYKPELTKISSTLDTTDPNNPSMTVVVKADANKTQAINGVNIDYKSDIVNTVTPNDITVYVNGEEANTITKQIVSAEASINAETGKKEITYTIKLTNFDEGKRKTDENGNITKFNEWSGNISIQFAKGTIKDMYGSQFNNDGQFTNIAGNGNIAEFTNKDNVTNKILIQEDEQYDKNTTGKMFADTINPEFTYEYANTVIDHDTKTVTVVFDVADKYFETSGLTADTTAEKIALKIGGVTPTNATKTLTKISDLTATVNGVENTKVGEKYQLVVSNIDQGDGGDYSGVMTMTFEAGLLTDKSGNESIAKTITIGIDEPATDDEPSTDGPYLPTGFTHVEGTSLDNGYTVQDSKGNQFVWVEVPKTADVYPTAGLDITEFTTDAYTKIENDLQTYTSVYREDGCTDEWGAQTATGLTSDQYTELKQKMLRSVYKNGGFYIGKYETGIEGTPRTSGDANTMPTETPVIKQNAYPYTCVTSSQAQTLASGFASNLNGYTSSLLFGVQWDLTLKYLETKGATQAELKEDSTNWGNYYDNSWNITNTNSKYSINGSTWTNGAYGQKSSNEYVLLSTGASDTFSKQGIYDLAGNVDEWTLEAAYYSNNRTSRGGFYDASDRFTASYRYSYIPTYASTGVGSRLALYKDVALATDSDASGTGSKPVIVDVVDPIWKIKNVNIDSASKKVTADVIATDKYLSGVANSTLTTNDITLTVDGDENANNAITKTLSTPTFSENTETGLKEIRYTLTLENWEEAEKQTGKTFLEYSGTAKIKIAEGTVVDDAEGALEPGQVSDGKHNTNREYEFELGHVDLIKPRIEKEKAETDETAKTETITFNVVDKYLDTTKEITADEIKVYVDGEEATTLTKELTRVEANDKSATINGNAQVVSQQYQLKLSDFEKARNDKNYKDWSGTVTIVVAENAVKDKVIESGTDETGKNTSGGNTNDVTEIDGKFVDFITPDLKYVHQDVDIDKTGKTYTMTFTVTDKYYKSGKLGIDDLTIKMQNGQKDADGNEIIYNLKNEPVTISLQDAELKAQNVPITNETTGVVETVSELLIGHTYTLTISDLEQLEIKEGLSTADYSGIVTVAVDGNKIKDRGPNGNNTNANGNIATTITSGVDIPGGTTPDDAKVVDVVDPIWEKISSSASAIDPADKTSSTATVKFRGTDTYFTESTLTSDKIKVLVNGAEATGITKELSEATVLNEQRKAFGSDTITTKQYGVEYTLTIKGFAQNADQVKVQIPAGCMTDESGNSNKVTDLVVYNVLRNTASENSETGAFLGNTSIQRQNIENVTFETSVPDTVYNATTGEYVNNTAWDVSAKQDKSIIAWYETSNNKGALKVHIGSNDEIFANQDSSYLFANIGRADICTATEAITNINLLNVTGVTNMTGMFNKTGYTAMTNLDLGTKFDTSNVTEMNGIFAETGYNAMTVLNLGDKFDTSNVTRMSGMFRGTGYTAMTSLDLKDKFDTGKVTEMSYMFQETGYTAMTRLNLGNKFDTSNVTDMSHMFEGTGYTAMTSFNLRDKFNTSKVNDMGGMFQETGYTALTSLDLGDKFDTSNVTDMEYMFCDTGYTAMTSLELGEKFDTSNVTNMSGMFKKTGYTAMTSLDLGDKFDTSNVTNMNSMFLGTGSTAMTTLDLGPAFTKIANTNTDMFTDTGKDGEITIYASEQIYLDKNNFKKNTDATESLISFTRGTINPKYRTEWVKEASTISKADKNIAITLRGRTNAEAGVDFTSNVTSSLTAENIHVYFDGEEATTITKSLANATTATNAVTNANDVLQVLTLSNLEEALRQQGKNFKEWSGNITLKIDKKTLTDDTYSNQNLQAIDTTGEMIDIELKDTATDKNENSTMFTDYINPEFTYEYFNTETDTDANTVIDYERKTITVVFDVTDKYFKESNITADNMTIKVGGEEPDWTKSTKTLTKKTLEADKVVGNITYKANGDIYYTVNGTPTKIGERYELVVSNLEVENGVGYSGAMTLSFPAGELNSDGTLKNGIVDKSGNLSINKTITIGIDEPENPEHPDHKQDEKIVDLVNPLWTGPHNVNSINRTNNTVDIKLLGSDQYYDTDVFAQGLANGTINEALSKIKVYVDGEEQTSITKSIVKITDSTELQELIAKSDLQSAKAEDVKVGYTLTLGNFGELNGETKIVIEAGTITDLSGNRNRETTIPVGNISWKEANEPLQESDTGYPRYHAFREDIVDFVKPVIRYQYSAVEDDTTKANPEIDYEAKTLTVRFTVTDKYLVESSVMNADGTLNTNNVRLKISTLSDSGNEEFKDITDEGISTTITSTQITDGYEYTLVVKDFEQVYNNKGKYMDYSGIVQLAFAEGQIDDTSGNKNIATTITVDTGTGDNPNGGVVVDVIDPIIEKTAENLSIVNSSNGINRDKENETGTVTMMIKATDKYLSTGTLQNAENVAKIKVKVVKPDGTEVIPDTITKSVTQVSKQSTSITYRITLGNFETNEGVTSVIIPEGVITDTSGNGNKETEMLVGNSTWTETGDAKGEYTAFKNSIVDFTMPVWKYATSSITRNRDGETGTVKVKILGSDIYYLKDTLTTDNIFVYVANSETPDAPVTTITKSLEKITDTADLEGADTGYYLTLGNFGTHDGQVKITIADNTIKDTSGNGNKITEMLVGNPNWVETDVGDSSESPKYTAFRDSIVDFIKPTLKYKYTADANPIIDQENKTFTMTFDATDTNFLESSLTVSDIRILVDDVDVTDTLTKTLTSADITDGSANGLRYTLTLKDFELERILEGEAFKRHSGKIELVVAAGKVKDTSGNENIETRIIVDNDDGDDAENYVRVDFIKPTLYFVEKHISWDNRYATVTIAGTDRFYDFNTKLDPNDIKLYQENLNGEYVQVTNLPVSINSVKTDYGYNFVIRLDDFEEEYKMKISIPAGKIGDLDGHYNDATDIIVGLDNKKPVWRYLSTDTSQFESDGKVSFNVKGQDKFLDLTKSGLQDGDVSVYRDGVNISDSVGITINYQGQDETEKSKSYKIDVSGMTETGTYSLVFKDKTLIDEFNNESATTTITFSKSIISSNTDNYQKVTYHASPDFETTHEAYVHELMSVNTTGTNAEATTFRPSTVGEIYDDGKNTLFAEPFSYAGGTQSAYSFKGWALANENGFIIDKDGNKLATSEGSTFDETKATIYGLYDEIPDTAKSADDMVHLKAVWQNAKVIFVSNGNGNNSADGLSPTTPVKDLQTAYGKLNTNGTASTNIIVIMDKVEWKDSTKLTGNATITSLYAGVDYKASGAELKISSNLEVDGDIKFDNIKLYSNSTTVNDGSDYLANETYTNMLITNYGDVTLGRRISTPDDKYTFGAVVGGNYKTESTIGEIGIHSVIVEAGRYNNIVIGSALNAGGQTTKSKYVSHQVLIGNMKDSAISRNDKLTITGSLLMGELEDRCYPYNSSGSQDTANAYTRTYAITKIYSGTFTGHNKFAKASEDASIYLRSMNGFTDGATRFEMYGGNITGNVYAGARMATTGADQDENILNFYGGNITGNVFGHGSNDASVGHSNIELGGNFAITGNVFGGSNATTIGQGRITGNTTITVNTASANINGNIYGGSNGTINGDSINLNNGAITGNTNVVINAGVITGNIYGGGNNCGSSGSANITINNGAISGDIYGGAYQNQVRTESNIVIKGGSVNNIYGGNELTSQAQQNNDGSRQNTNITIEGANAKVEGTIYGGGTFEKVATATINLNSCETVPTVYGGSKGAGITEEANINLNGMTVSTIYGGTNGNGTVTTANINLKSGTVTDVYGGGYGGTTTTSNINLGSSDGGTATVTSIYGGPNLGGTVGTSNVMLKSGTVTNVFGGGNSAEVGTANVTLDGITIDTIHGGSKDSRVTANTNVVLKSGTVTNVFGGGLGTSTTNAKVTQQGANVENIYGGGYGGTGNGGTTANATVNIDSGKVENVYGGSMNKGITRNAIINIRGTSLITNKIYGGGYKTDIGKSDNSGSTTINISGGTINKDLFGGAEGAVVHGITNINIGVDAVSDNSPVAGKINIRGNIYGGGTSTSVDYSLNSVEGDTHITMTNSTRSPITFSKNIFGSGKGTNYSTNNTNNDGSTIKLNNFGTSRSSYRMTSIQRTGKVSIGNSYLELSGAQDNYNYYRNTLYTLNRVTKGLALHDNTTLYTRRGFNMVGGFESYLTDASGNQTKETISISGNTVTRNVDNRIYTFEGINLIFAKQEGELSDKTNQDIWGDVSGMAFFGMYRINRTSFEKEYDIYAPNYTGGAKENFFANGTYIEGRHKANHDTTVDGFYTNVGDYTDPSNITVFPKVIEVTDYGTYYDWIIGEDIVNYDVGPLIASTYSTYSTAELKLDYKYRQGAIYTLNRVSANAIDENINLVNSSSIPTIASGDSANNTFAVTMEGEKTGWLQNGVTNMYTDNNGSFDGNTVYKSDNSSNPGSLIFKIHNSINVSETKDLGNVNIVLIGKTRTADDASEGNVFRVIISVSLQSLYEEPKEQYTPRFTDSTETNLNYTTDSSIDVSYLLYKNGLTDTIYETGDYRVLSSTVQLPAGTKITMRDYGQGDSVNKVYNYQIGSNTAYDATETVDGKTRYLYKLSHFKNIGTNVSDFSGTGDYRDNNSSYYHSGTNGSGYVLEKYDISIDLENSNINTNKLAQETYLQLRSADGRLKYDNGDKDLTYNLYNNNATMKESISNEGKTYSVFENLTIPFTLDSTLLEKVVGNGGTVEEANGGNATESTRIHDTKYYDKKVGLGIEIIDDVGERVKAPEVQNLQLTDARDSTIKYEAGNDGVIRIPLSEGMANIKNSYNLSLSQYRVPAGTYKVKVYFYASDDGLYYEGEKTVVKEFNITFINRLLGLAGVESTNDSRIINKTTGMNLEGNRGLDLTVKVSSPTNDTNVRVELYKRNPTYTETEDASGTGSTVGSYTGTQYTLVDLGQYLEGNWEKPEDQGLETPEGHIEYIVMPKETYESVIPVKEVEFKKAIKENIGTGEYKLVFKACYDNTVIQEVSKTFVVTP